MSVRCRRFQTDSVGKVHWTDQPGHGCGVMQGRDLNLASAACAFLSSLPQARVVAVCEGTSLYGVSFVSVYYREEVSHSPV